MIDCLMSFPRWFRVFSMQHAVRRGARASWFAGGLVLACASGGAVAAVPGAMGAITAGDCAGAGKEINAGLQAEDAQAYFLAGFLYDRTGCVTKDPTRAARLYRKASALGDRDAPIYLGLLHGLGRGVPQDYVRAHRAFNGKDTADDAVAPPGADEAMLGYVETIAHLAERQITYPTTANALGTEASLDVVLEPTTGRITFDHVKVDVEVGSTLSRVRSFEDPLEEAYRAAIVTAPKVTAAGGATSYATPWQFRMRRDGFDKAQRLEGYATVGPASAVR